MNIANLSFSGAWGGLEMSSVKYTRLFHQAGHKSFEICLPDSPIHKALTEQGLEAKTLTPSRNYLSVRASLKIRDWLKTEKVDALFLHSMKDIWLVTPALAGLPDIKLFGFARMFFKDISKKDPLHAMMYARLNKMIALTQIQAGHLEKCLPVAPEKFIVIPNGVDIERFQPRSRREDIRTLWGVKPEHVLFGLIGRLDKQKGSLEFVEAAAQVLKQQPNARFVLVGGNTIGEGDFDKLVHTRLRELDLAGHAGSYHTTGSSTRLTGAGSTGTGTNSRNADSPVILTDFRKDIPDVMNALDVFCMPSYEENFGNVMIEAFASGLPCIGTNAGGSPEVLDRGQTGLLAEPKSADSLARVMLQLLAEPSLRQDLAHRARKKAIEVYDMNKIFKRIEALASGS